MSSAGRSDPSQLPSNTRQHAPSQTLPGYTRHAIHPPYPRYPVYPPYPRHPIHSPSARSSRFPPYSRQSLYALSDTQDGGANMTPGPATIPAAQYVDLTADTVPSSDSTYRFPVQLPRHPSFADASRHPLHPSELGDTTGRGRHTMPQQSIRMDGSMLLENDGFEIVAQRPVPPHLRAQASATPNMSGLGSFHYEALSYAHRSAVGSFISSLSRNIPGALGRFLPPALDYNRVGFPIGNTDTSEVEHIAAPDPPPIRYQSPPLAPAGFTYTPDEEEVYVCPNCDEELRTGDSDAERQVWVVKACGHAYCGQCAQNRSITKNKKLKSPSKSKPFKQCVVDGCVSKTTGVKSMVQIYI